MTASVIDLKNVDDLRDVVHRGVEALAAGQVIALPTETVYGLAASALREDAVARLLEIKGRDPNKPLAFAIKSYEDALDYVPNLSALGRRIARRCWPGPITIVVDNNHPDSVIQRLPQLVQDVTVPTGTVGLRVPAHEVALQILRLSAGPMVLTSANEAGGEPAITGQQVIDNLSDSLDLILDDGPCRFGQPSSVVKITENDIEFLRHGVIDEKTLNRMAAYIALVVCTGNTCRSPMGEAIMRKRFADKIGCKIEELEDHGVTVISAGIAAMPGGRATPQAVDVMKKMGLDINGHSSQPVTYRLAQFADLILTMTNGHRQAIVSQWPNVEPRVNTLRQDGVDVSDPIGMPVEAYQSCADQIDESLTQWIDGIQL